VTTAVRRSTYDKSPVVQVGTADQIAVGASACRAEIAALGGRVLAVETYPGVRMDDVRPLLSADVVIDVASAYRSPTDLDALVGPELTDDPVFGRLTSRTIADFFDPALLDLLRERVEAASGSVALVGTGASLVASYDTLVYADLPRWEIQQRQRRGESGNLGADNAGERPSVLYKRGFFLDWRAADRLKASLLDHVDAFLDTTTGTSKVVAGAAVRAGLDAVVRRPFRVVPFFDPAPWGGTWMEEVCDLPPADDRYGWCFDCVPEENSVLLGFGEHTLELPALDVVMNRPSELLGERVRARFGDEFPIRFDFLDTMGGGNLSLQVHPLTERIRDEFGWGYTQDESYYLLDAEPDACVYLGLRSDIDPEQMLADLEAAQQGGPCFPADRHINVVPARKHDHFLIPAGTVHCSGANAMVLEISATPFIFTFKLWDWDRLGLDGRPRPINIDRGRRSIRWDRTTAYVESHLVNAVTPLDRGPGWVVERTGLHEAEPLETHRHWFTDVVPHETHGSVNVLNLVEGEQVTVEGDFQPFVVHYAETFIVPAAVGRYTIRPSGRSEGSPCATIKAFVRP
jgi:mannose-6-phosphate isomerase class I